MEGRLGERVPYILARGIWSGIIVLCERQDPSTGAFDSRPTEAGAFNILPAKPL